jgi:beta-fructofuranosidase
MTTRRGFLVSSVAAAGAIPSTGATANPAVAKAMQAVRAAIPKAGADPERPVYHFRPPAQWNNDPNGTIFYKGWHHLFYQHNPYAARWDSMHWGHSRSRDLVNWEHLPIALWPSKEKGEDHVFSGGAIEGPDGRPRLFYTSIGKRAPEQWLAIPQDDDLIVWEKYAGNPVLSVNHHGAYDVQDWRDPFLFREQGGVYMVCGGNLRPSGGRAAVQLYEATNRELTAWKHLGPVFEYRKREIANIECPNLFKLGTRWVLLISPHQPCEYFVGDLDLKRPKFLPETHGVLDPGAAYASNISFDDKGRTILWLWGRTATNPEKGWHNVMTLPRILSLDSDGYLRQNPAPEFEALRGPVRSRADITLDNRSVPLGPEIAGDCLELEASFTADSASLMGLRTRGVEIAFNPRGGSLNAGGVRTFLARNPNLQLRVFLDKRTMELYANHGAAAIFTTVDANPNQLQVEAFATGGAARLKSLRFWPLKPARFSLERFTVS